MIENFVNHYLHKWLIYPESSTEPACPARLDPFWPIGPGRLS